MRTKGVHEMQALDNVTKSTSSPSDMAISVVLGGVII